MRINQLSLNVVICCVFGKYQGKTEIDTAGE